MQQGISRDRAAGEIIGICTYAILCYYLQGGLEEAEASYNFGNSILKRMFVAIIEPSLMVGVVLAVVGLGGVLFSVIRGKRPNWYKIHRAGTVAALTFITLTACGLMRA